MSIELKLDSLVSKHNELENILSNSHELEHNEYARLSREFVELKEIVEVINTYRKKKVELSDLEIMASDQEIDLDIKKLANDELKNTKSMLKELEKDIQLLLLPKDEADEKNAILEVRAGTGGEEAALFAANLFRMYQRFAEQQNWKFEYFNISETGIGGFKEASANIRGKNVFAKLKYESGVHRVQRVPDTESQGRVHTSAATVAVLPEVEEVDVEINTKDLRIDTYRAQGAGGQHVNKTDSAVRITHLPSGTVAQCQDEKSQHKNKTKAMKLLRSRLYDLERSEKDKERATERKNQVGSGDRSERIRTYNFPQGRVTDHRVNLTIHKLDKVMEGELEEIVEALASSEQAKLLSEIES